ncbi:MAG: hypothetical protein KGZ82_03215 [Bacteroidales bacterium]|nr:hypothetical protein [Bacteroidales bacterium]
MKSHTFRIESLTPIYIGGNSDKNWQENIDYIYRAGKIYIMDIAKIARSLTPLELSRWSAALLNRDDSFFNQFFSNRKLSDYALISYPSETRPRDVIRAFSRNGLGQAFIPGSSVKGAIRSMLIAELFTGQPITKQADIDALFGNISNNLMHYIQVSDVIIEPGDLELTMSKIFNLHRQGEWKGGWKHGGSIGTTNDFDPNKFTTAYETIYPEKMLGDRLHLLINEKLFQYHQNQLDRHDNKHPVPPHFSKLFGTSTDPVATLFRIINKHIKKQLIKEKEFYRTYEVEETDYIVDYLDDIVHQITDDGESCVLRIGQGSGYYGITGDWKFKDHLTTIGVPSFGKHYKSRKWSFVYQDDELYLSPFGFIKLNKE